MEAAVEVSWAGSVGYLALAAGPVELEAVALEPGALESLGSSRIHLLSGAG